MHNGVSELWPGSPTAHDSGPSRHDAAADRQLNILQLRGNDYAKTKTNTKTHAKTNTGKKTKENPLLTILVRQDTLMQTAQHPSIGRHQ